ncbi:MAG: LrgB family protein [Tyzzerella sp.]|nr:LrgB family protein [Tyzzerella sp.]
MNNLFLNSTTLGVVISLLAYQFGMFLKNKTRKAFVNPLLISIVLVILFLLAFDIDYESYNQSAKYLSYLLTPATVSLAIPLYQQMELLKKHGTAIVLGISAGVLTSLLSVLAMSVLFGLKHEEYVTLLPKSITSAIGMGLSEELGGYATITIAVIIVTGIFGNMIAEFVCKLFRINHPISKGLAIGTSSHAMGTTKAMELGQIEGAMSSLSIVVAGLLTVILASFFAMLY